MLSHPRDQVLKSLNAYFWTKDWDDGVLYVYIFIPVDVDKEESMYQHHDTARTVAIWHTWKPTCWHTHACTGEMLNL